jgi:hypothetical protein
MFQTISAQALAILRQLVDVFGNGSYAVTEAAKPAAAR